MLNPRNRSAKKLASLLTAVLCGSLLIPAVTVQSARADAPVFTTSDNGDGTVTITDCTGCSGDIEIPGTIDGNLVSAIGYMALFSKQLTSVTIPSSVISIGSYAFAFNQLASVSIPNSVVSIGSLAFANDQLVSVIIPNSVTSIGVKAFQKNGMTSLTLSNNLTSIGEAAFWQNSLTSVTIPDSLTNIGPAVFAINQLTSITIPNTVTNISNWAFSDNLLPDVTIPRSVTNIGQGAFKNNHLTAVTFLGDAPTLGGDIYYENTDLTSVVVPSDGTGFGDTFSGVTVSYTGDPIRPVFSTSDNGDGTVTITGCTANCATALVIPGTIAGKTVTSIGEHAFWLSSLTSVSIPDSVASIGIDAFYVNNLTSVTIPRSVTNIGNNAFYGNKLSSVTFLGDAPSDGGWIFDVNPNLHSVTAPSDATGFGVTFSGITVSFTGDPIHPVFTTSDNGDGTVTITGCTANCAGDLVIPETISGNTVTVIGHHSLDQLGLTSVTIPNSVTSIESSAFQNNQLTSVSIPKSVKSIGSFSFFNNQITAVTIPESVSSIGGAAFMSNALTAVTFLGDAPAGGGYFADNSNLLSIVVPSDATGFGLTLSGVSVSYTGDPIHASVFTTSENGDGTLTITGCSSGCSGALFIPGTIAEKTVTSIGEYALRNKALTSVTIPSSVTSMAILRSLIIS